MHFLKYFFIIILFFLGGCFQNKQINGIASNKINSFNLEIGKTSKVSIVNRFGPPSFESPFNKNTIYYISQNTIYNNLEAPRVEKMILYEVHLDKNNIVQKINKYDEKEIVDLKIADDVIGQNENTLAVLLKEMVNNLQRRNFKN